MPNALHLINRREGITLHGLTRVAGAQNTYRSACWQLTDADANSLQNGWVYLHEAKAKPSTMGGTIVEFEEGAGECTGRKIIVFRSSKHGKGQRWRGADHAMAMNGGVIEAAEDHEQR